MNGVDSARRLMKQAPRRKRVLSTVSDVVRHSPNLGFTPVASPGSGAYGFNTSAPADAQIMSTNASQAIAVTSTNAGQQAVSITQPTMLATIYIKL
jgi:hypothetical protein